MKRVLVLLIAGTALSGLAAVYSNVSLSAQAADKPARTAAN